MTTTAPHTGRLARFVPMLQWLPHYQRAWLTPDVVAGLSVWALLIPQGIAYAGTAGVPAEYGLYTALGALVGYAVFGTSGQVITGPSATVAAVSASVVALLATAGTQTWTSFTAALAVTAGLVYLLLGFARMGWIANFLSRAVLEGFIFGFGIGLTFDQLHKILGVPKVDGSYVQVLIGTLEELPETNPTTLAIGVAAIALLLAMRRFAPRLPRALIVVILGIIVSVAIDAPADGVAVVGTVPTGLPSLALPAFPIDEIPTLILGALAVIFVGYSESLAAASNQASKHGYEINPSQEMVAQGAATGLSGLLGGYVVDGSLSKTSVADLAGQKTQMGSLVAAAGIVLTLLILAPLFTDLPEAVLGAVIIDAAIGLIKVDVARRFARTSRRDFAAFLAAALGLLFIGVLAGVLIGVVLSLVLLIAAVSTPPVRRLGFDRAHDVYVDADRYPTAETAPGIVVVEVSGALFFADARPFRDAVMPMATRPGVHCLVVDLGPSTFIDLDGADILTKVAEELGRRGVAVVLARVDDDRLDLLEQAGTVATIGGRDRIFPSVREAVAAQAGRAQPAADPPASANGSD